MINEFSVVYCVSCGKPTINFGFPWHNYCSFCAQKSNAERQDAEEGGSMALEGFEVVEDDEVKGPQEVSENFYEQEYEEIKKNEERNDAWKPDTGLYEVKLLSEINKFTFTKDGETKERAVIDIELQGNKYAWFMGVGKTERSIYGQLIYLGKKWKSLKGKTIQVNVLLDKDGKRQFSVIEYSKEKQREKETSQIRG